MVTPRKMILHYPTVIIYELSYSRHCPLDINGHGFLSGNILGTILHNQRHSMSFLPGPSVSLRLTIVHHTISHYSGDPLLGPKREIGLQ